MSSSTAAARQVCDDDDRIDDLNRIIIIELSDLVGESQLCGIGPAPLLRLPAYRTRRRPRYQYR
ncbi:MAG: hypothetical protein R3C11_09470 [Planctomycetaceae bacterium]